ncbi:hypothetical protein Agabi119p4_8709 [Agaricus bisporus var. burnettii]|uniref:BTB domain-containing protein n=1 Tax=Agaricus bisporus var. burnettii TaxID=192524 RepID=A0A8H7EXF8_AGABI|nr:hypothetical protein Agabi119p4_8709 [Agaricus bisporus var. burnettii]
MQAKSQPEASEPVVIQNSTAEPPTSMPKRNDKYFLNDDPMAVFQVEDQLFKVHQHHLAKASEHFREMFAKPGEAAPIPLPGVGVAEFESLLDYFYESHESRFANFSIQGSLDLLSISHKYQVHGAVRSSKVDLDFSSIRSNSTLTPLQKHSVGDLYGFDDWVSSALKMFLEREEPLSVEEAIALGFDRLADFVETREEQLEDKIRDVEHGGSQIRVSPLRGCRGFRGGFRGGFVARGHRGRGRGAEIPF